MKRKSGASGAYEAFGLNRAEIGLLSRSEMKRDYYYLVLVSAGQPLPAGCRISINYRKAKGRRQK